MTGHEIYDQNDFKSSPVLRINKEKENPKKENNSKMNSLIKNYLNLKGLILF